MELITSATVGLFILLLILVLTSVRRRNYPPGPYGLPFIGYAPFFGPNPGETFTKLKTKYGNIMSLSMGVNRWVVLNDYEVIHEAFVRQADKFSGRPFNYLSYVVGGGRGILFANDTSTWKALRKIGQTTLRGFGVGAQSMEEGVKEEAIFLLQNLTSKNEFNLRRKMALAVSNVISRLAFGSRFSYSDGNFKQMIHFLDEFFSAGIKAKLLGLLMLMPYLRHLPGFRGLFRQRMVEVHEYMDILEAYVDQHRKTFQKTHVRDLIDVFLQEIADARDRKDDSKHPNSMQRGERRNQNSVEIDVKSEEFYEKHIVHFVRELYEAGSSTTSSTLIWAILALAHYPTCQDKISEEILKVIGHDGIPSMSHKEQMPYTRAFIHEIMRHRTLGPIGGLLHRTNGDAVLQGFDIPKDTVVVANIWAVHYDPTHFQNPEEFCPERFIDENGDFVESNRAIPFLIGHRQCLGQQLAKTEIFIFLTNIVKDLRILPHPETPLPRLDKGVFNGITFEAKDFEITFEKR